MTSRDSMVPHQDRNASCAVCCRATNDIEGECRGSHGIVNPEVIWIMKRGHMRFPQERRLVAVGNWTMLIDEPACVVMPQRAPVSVTGRIE